MEKRPPKGSARKAHFSGQENKHEKFENELVVELSNRANCRLFKREVGLGYRADGTPFHYGFVGETDLQGIIQRKSGVGQFLAIEIKTGSGRLSPAQERYKQFVLRLGGFYIEARWNGIEHLREAINRVTKIIDELE